MLVPAESHTLLRTEVIAWIKYFMFFSDRFKAVHVFLWILFVKCVSRVSMLCCFVCSLQPCDHLLGKHLFASLRTMFSCVLPLSHIVYYLILSILNLCKKDGKDQESIQSGTTPDPEYHMG